LMTLVSVTAYHSFSGEVEALNTPTIRRLTPSRRHQLPRITLLMIAVVIVFFVHCNLAATTFFRTGIPDFWGRSHSHFT
jgi:hypothetical protein